MTGPASHTADPDLLDEDLERVLDRAGAAAPILAEASIEDRAVALVAIADALDVHRAELVAAARAETGLPGARLAGELTRTCVQLRMFAQEVRAGAFLDVVVDRADPQFVLGPRPELRRYQIPVGPVLVFAASNFPFAFSVAGADTAAALAAGCAVILKAHPGHPRTSELTATVVREALASVDVPDGAFALITGVRSGTRALQDPRVAAAAFTGSVAGGRALFDIAAARPNPIPFYGELGSINPVVITRGALDERLDEIATGFVGSFTLGTGQFCTKPGLLLVPAGSAVVDRIAELTAQVAETRMLTSKITQGYRARLDTVSGVAGVEVLVTGTGAETQDGDTDTVPTVSPSLLLAPIAQLDETSTLLEESFGPAAVIAEYHSDDDVEKVLTHIQGTLTVTLHVAARPSADEVEQVRAWGRLAATRAGRVVFNGWPTGVAVTPAQHHGGPYPATTAIAHTSVGTAAIRRFLRPVVYQDAPDEVLPPAVQDANPLRVPRVINEAGESGTWGHHPG